MESSFGHSSQEVTVISIHLPYRSNWCRLKAVPADTLGSGTTLCLSWLAPRTPTHSSLAVVCWSNTTNAFKVYMDLLQISHCPKLFCKFLFFVWVFFFLSSVDRCWEGLSQLMGFFLWGIILTLRSRAGRTFHLWLQITKAGHLSPFHGQKHAMVLHPKPPLLIGWGAQ